MFTVMNPNVISHDVWVIVVSTYTKSDVWLFGIDLFMRTLFVGAIGQCRVNGTSGSIDISQLNYHWPGGKFFVWISTVHVVCCQKHSLMCSLLWLAMLWFFHFRNEWIFNDSYVRRVWLITWMYSCLPCMKYDVSSLLVDPKNWTVTWH